ncbi:protein brambleberry-like isoform X1 [Larus michahellis]|uniref:protein brambleberry-like isoform X1 n=2 Tax=Larus michahellis TaxID=119627 RepID=UPI003D9B8E65
MGRCPQTCSWSWRGGGGCSRPQGAPCTPFSPQDTPTIIMVSWSCWALLLLCAIARFFGWLGLGTPLEEVETPPEVVVRLRSSCTDPSEEEVAKLGVDVFDCQANAKGRWTNPSTPDAEGQEELQEQPGKFLQPRLETLITSREHQVAQLMEDIAQRMGNVSSHGTMGLQEGHRVVLSDLHHTQERARDIYSQLEHDVALLLAQQCRMEEVMEKLRQVNRSLGLMLVAVEGAQSRLENQLEHLHATLDPAGELGMGAGGQMGAGGCHHWALSPCPAGQSPSAISTCILHGSYLLLLVALLVPMPPRAILLLLAFSILGELLGIPALSTLLALAVAGQLLVMAARRGAGGPWLVPLQEEPRHQLTSTPERECKMELLQEEMDRLEMSCLQEPSCLEQPPVMAGDTPRLAGRMSSIPGGWRTKLSSCGAMLEPAMGTGKHWEPKPCTPSQSLASDMSSLSPRLPCQGLTRAGQRCRKKAILGQDFCHVHTTG